jgi:hypothetical protein
MGNFMNDGAQESRSGGLFQAVHFLPLNNKKCYNQINKKKLEVGVLLIKEPRKIYCWLAFILLFLSLSIICNFLNVSVFQSSYLVFYGFSILGAIIGSWGWKLLKSETKFSLTKIVGYIGFHGNLAMVILFFPPIYHIWGTLILGP